MKKNMFRKACSLLLSGLLLGGLLNMPDALIPAAEAAAPSFYSGFEPSDPIQPKWSNEAEQSRNVTGICCGIPQMESNVTQEAHQTGNHALLYAGNGADEAYSYNQVFEVDIPVQAATSLSYWIYPESESTVGGTKIENGTNSTFASVDLKFEDGTYLHDVEVLDQNGVRLTPEEQGRSGMLLLDTWNFVTTSIGTAASGKTISRILISYGQTDHPGTFRGYVDEIQIRGSEFDGSQYADPMVGTQNNNLDIVGYGGNRGNTFPGATLPFGMVQWSPDTGYNDNGSGKAPLGGGYDYDAKSISGFSLTHISGPGCDISQNVPFLPVVGTLGRSPGTNFEDYASSFSHSTETSVPGYYSVTLDKYNVKTELTATARTGLGRFTFPSTTQASMLINAGVDGNGVREGSVNIEGNTVVTGSVRTGGFCSSKNGGNLSSNNEYTVYFAAEFSQPFTESGTWIGGQINKDSASQRSDIANNNRKVGAFVKFDTTANQAVLVKVGVSYVSIDNAKLNMKTENAGWNFDSVKKSAQSDWKQKLNAIQVSGGTDSNKRIFYSALYHSFIHPNVFSDVNGEYIGMDNQIHRADGYTHYANFSGWDVYRSQVQLIAVLFPQIGGDLAQSLINDAIHRGGFLPKWISANSETYIMNGDPASITIANMYAFGAKQFNTADALKVMDYTASTPSSLNPRANLDYYLSLGFIPVDKSSWGTGYAIEYENADFALAQFAKALGDMDKYNLYMNRAQTWMQSFNPETGYIQPRTSDGKFEASFNPGSNRGFQETNPAQMTWMLPFNYEGLIEKMGGTQKAAERLDYYFTELNAGDSKPYAFLGNEPSFGDPWIYNWVGQPYKTQDVVRRAMTELFHDGPSGLIGNDDLGATSSWYIWAALGLYPEIPGIGGFTLHAPLFEEALINLGDCKQIRIHGNGASDSAKYVQSLNVNGSLYTSTWLPYGLIASGGDLDFTLGTAPNTSWGTGPQDIPPSYSDLGTQVVHGASYKLVNKWTGQTLEAAGGNDGDPVRLGADVSSEAQRWTLEGSACSAYTIMTGSHKALQETAAEDGTSQAVIQSANGSPAQQWLVEPTDDGYYKLIQNGTRRLLTAASQSGSDMIMRDADQSDAQKWKLIRTVKPDVIYKLVNVNSGKALEVAQSGSTAQTGVQIGAYTEAPYQHWKIVSLAGGGYQLVNQADGHVLDVQNGGTANLTKAQMSANEEKASQQWNFIFVAGDTFKVINVNSKRALDVSGSGVSDGTPVQIYDDNGSGAQQWQLVPVME